MKRKLKPCLYKRGDVYHMDKQVFGQRIRESTHARTLVEAEQYMAHRLEEIRQARIYGVRPERTFFEASEKFVQENQHKRSIENEISILKTIMPFIGDLPLRAVHMGSLQIYINARRADGVKNRTINYGLQIARRVLNLAATEWMDDDGLTWLSHAPKIKLLAQDDARSAYPMTWQEQDRLFQHLPDHLKNMALFAVNSGCREQEICCLKWKWEHEVEELNTSVFVIPAALVKNGDNRLVVLNRIAQSVVQSCRGNHPEYVFTYKGNPIKAMNTTAWKNARRRAQLDVRVHDLKHTFGRRLRAAGVSFEDRQDLLGHKSSRVTTNYSVAEIEGLLAAANRVCDRKRSTPILRVIRGN